MVLLILSRKPGRVPDRGCPHLDEGIVILDNLLIREVRNANLSSGVYLNEKGLKI
jgi:hypothetical protein